MAKIHNVTLVQNQNTQKIEPGRLQTFEHTTAIKESDLEILSSSEIQKQLYTQANTRQTTVLEHNGEIIASFSENGWRHFQHNRDFDPNFSTMSDSEIIDSLRKRYGSSLIVNTYATDQGPTYAEVFEQVHGHKPTFFDFNV